MSLKQFLKPDSRKIVVFVILLILLFFGFANTPFQIISVVVYPLTLEGCKPGSKVCQQVFNWFIIISWLLLYILACFIVWIYYKVRKK